MVGRYKGEARLAPACTVFESWGKVLLLPYVATHQEPDTRINVPRSGLPIESPNLPETPIPSSPTLKKNATRL